MEEVDSFVLSYPASCWFIDLSTKDNRWHGQNFFCFPNIFWIYYMQSVGRPFKIKNYTMRERHTRYIPVLNPTNVCLQVCGWEQLDCHTGHKEVSRFHTRDESILIQNRQFAKTQFQKFSDHWLVMIETNCFLKSDRYRGKKDMTIIVKYSLDRVVMVLCSIYLLYLVAKKN